MSDSALRSLLALIRLSFRFDPEESEWVKPERTFTRADVQAESGLSSQGARNGLAELAEAGWARVDQTGRSYEYELAINVPTSCYTYVPTALLDSASDLGGTELRVVLVTLRDTWGWTFAPESEGKDEDADVPPEHRRWARLSTSEMARRTGRSETAVKKAAVSLQGRYLERLRPTGGAYYYRFLPEAVMPESPEEKSPDAPPESPGRIEVRKRKKAYVSMGTSNDLPPDRQRSAPPYAIESSSFREAKHSAPERKRNQTDGNSSPRPDRDAVRASSKLPFHWGEPTEQTANSSKPSENNDGKPTSAEAVSSEGREGSPDSSNLCSFSGQLQTLGQTLINAGVRPGCVPALLTRFSAGRIRANVQLYHQRAPTVENPGAWLYAAVTQGYALPSSSGREEVSEAEDNSGTTVLPESGTKVSETRKQLLIRQGLATEDDFDKFADFDEPDRKQHFFQLEKR